MSHLSHCGMGAEPRANGTRDLLPVCLSVTHTYLSVTHTHTRAHAHTHTHTSRLLQGAKSWVAVAHSQSVCLSLTHTQIPVCLTHTHTHKPTHTQTHTDTHTPISEAASPRLCPPTSPSSSCSCSLHSLLMNSWPRLHQEHSVTGFSPLYIQFPGGNRGVLPVIF